MTKQQYYDLLVKSSGDGTFPSLSKALRRCMLRADATAHCPQRCAVGLLIEDYEYTPAFDGVVRGLVTLLEKRVLKVPEGMKIGDLLGVQTCHDSACFDSEPGWDRRYFLNQLNELKCFADVVKIEVPHA